MTVVPQAQTAGKEAHDGARAAALLGLGEYLSLMERLVGVDPYIYTSSPCTERSSSIG